MFNSDHKTVVLKGGLGNQLFQYSFAKFLKNKFRLNINLDISWFDNQSLRKLKIDNFINNNELSFVNNNFSILKKISFYRTEKIFIRMIKNNFLPPVDIFNGYWQDIFFANYLNQNNFNKKIFNRSSKKDYYVIHLRKGDFSASKVHYILPESYYIKSADLFKNKEILLLSPNKEEALEFAENTKIKATYADVDEEEAFSLIFNASGGIASNSTFCWWAIYLSKQRNWILPFQWLKKIDIFKHNLQIKNTIIL